MFYNIWREKEQKLAIKTNKTKANVGFIVVQPVCSQPPPTRPACCTCTVEKPVTEKKGYPIADLSASYIYVYCTKQSRTETVGHRRGGGGGEKLLRLHIITCCQTDHEKHKIL